VVLFPAWFIEPMTRDRVEARRPWVLEPKSLPTFLSHERADLSAREVAMYASHFTRYVRARQNTERKHGERI
jgi:hypothetical protein